MRTQEDAQGADRVMDDVNGFVEGLTEYMTELLDPRVVGRCEHRWMDIISIAILDVFCGENEWTESETFGKHQADWLKSFLPVPNGIPSHDAFQRTFGRLDRNDSRSTAASIPRLPLHPIPVPMSCRWANAL